jgi:hypothetical protein
VSNKKEDKGWAKPYYSSDPLEVAFALYFPED